MSLEKLKTQRKELVEKIDQLQTESSEKTFEIELDDRKQIKTIMDHLNKGFTWKTQNAAVVVSLYDQLKKQNKELANESLEHTDSEDASEAVLKLRAHELNGFCYHAN
jgi:cell division septal protein FtsQ